MANRLLKPLLASFILGATVWPPLLPLLTVSAFPVNATIDDIFRADSTAPLVTYSPEGAWETNCTNCTEVPIDASVPFLGTWHSTSISGDDVKASVTFQGTAVYVYCIVDNALGAELTFVIDGEIVGNFSHAGTGASAAQDALAYSVPVYVNESLGPQSNRLLEVVNHGALAILDSIVYTHDTSITSLSSSFTIPSMTVVTVSATPTTATTTTSFLSPTPSEVSSTPHDTGGSSSLLYATIVPSVIGGILAVMITVGLSVRAWKWYKARRNPLPPSALFMRDVEGGRAVSVLAAAGTVQAGPAAGAAHSGGAAVTGTAGGAEAGPSGSRAMPETSASFIGIEETQR